MPNGPMPNGPMPSGPCQVENIAVSRTVVAIRHLGFEDLGCFEPVLVRAGYTVRYRDVGVDALRAIAPLTPDLLVVLGGPIGAYEDDRYPFLRDEIAILAQRLAAGRPTIGICLGAQLMARALGARVYPGPEKEIGFSSLHLTEEGRASCVAVFDQAPVLHWHGDTFDLPEGAVRLASTPSCANQAFAYGRNAIAFQFHPEAGADGFERWLIGHAMELSLAGKSVHGLRAEHQACAPELKRRGADCLAAWLGQLAS
jgi:GMP synthase (glutamine-hydrolysing)